jgi:hypothetical protein
VIKYLFLIILIVVFGRIILATLSSHQRIDIEHEKEPLFIATSAVTIGRAMGWTKGFFGSLRIYDEFIVIGCGKKIVLYYEEIERVEIWKGVGWLFDRVQIVHRKPGVPPFILLDPSLLDTFDSASARVKEMIESRLPR